MRTLIIIATIAIVVIALCALQGCGTVIGLQTRCTQPESIVQPYLFTAFEYSSITYFGSEVGSLVGLGVLCDLPFTAITDTVLLPVDIPLSAYNSFKPAR